MNHADALHWVMSNDQNMVAIALPLCHKFILDRVPCATGRRVHDLVLHLFIEAGDMDWHLDVNGQPSAKRVLFSQYVAAGFIKINDPVAKSTAGAVMGANRNPPPDMPPLELALRKSSVATVVSLLDSGADESRVIFRKSSDDPFDILDAARLLPDNPDTVPLMVSSIAEALMRRRIGAQTPPAPLLAQAASRRSMSVI